MVTQQACKILGSGSSDDDDDDGDDVIVILLVVVDDAAANSFKMWLQVDSVTTIPQAFNTSSIAFSDDDDDTTWLMGNSSKTDRATRSLLGMLLQSLTNRASVVRACRCSSWVDAWRQRSNKINISSSFLLLSLF
jgi:hypothetical protein